MADARVTAKVTREQVPPSPGGATSQAGAAEVVAQPPVGQYAPRDEQQARDEQKQARTGNTRLLATSVVGSYSVPEWLERLKTDYYQRRISGAYLQEIHEVAIKAALKDQERAGVDIVSDGELRRDNDVDYFLARVPGIEIPHLAKTFYYDYYEAYVRNPLPVDDQSATLGLVQDLLFTLDYTDRPVKFSLTGPFSLSRRVKNEAYSDPADLVMAFARILNREVRALARAGAAVVQIDEPFLAGYPEQVELAIRAIDAVYEGVQGPLKAVHVCYGNRYARPVWEGNYDFLFPHILEAHIDQLVLEFARKGYDDLDLFRRYPSTPFLVGVGVIDVKSLNLETPDQVAARVKRALQVLPPDRLTVNPDCGLRHVPPHIALAKLQAMSQGASIVRQDVLGQAAETSQPTGNAA
jgi:5-methyltetrahydropteroyltriglutamate--homocysteine methyltransferase